MWLKPCGMNCGIPVCNESDQYKTTQDVCNNPAAVAVPGSWLINMDNFERAKQQFLEGIALLESGDCASAEGRFKTSLELLPGRVSTLTNLSTTQIVLHKFQDARANADAALAIDPDAIEGWLNLGLLEHHEARYREAVQAFNKALVINGQSIAAWKGLAGAHDALGENTEALRCYAEVLRHDGNAFEALSNTGAILNDLKRYAEALVYHQRALQLNPRHVQTLSNQGVALQGQGRLEAALASHEQALAVDPGYAEGWFNKGLVHRELGQLDKALEAYATAIRLNPEHAAVWASKGAVLHRLGRLEEALQAHQQSLALNSESAESWSNKGLTLQELGRFEEALADYEKALTLKPDFAEVYSHQGLLLTELRRAQAALVACDQALSLKPDYAEAHNNRGLALKALKRLDEAIGSFERAIALKPEFAEAYSNRGLALQAQGNLDAAIASYEQAIVLKPEFAEANWNQALALLLKEDWARGWALYEWGFDAKKRGGGHRQALAPDWDGQVLQGSLLVLPEQGVGDEIFYSGMLNDLRGRAKTITVCVDPRLVPLYQRSFDHVHVVSSRELAKLPPHEAQVYMASLGRYVCAQAQGMNAVRTPYLKASAERAQTLRQQIAGAGKIICGLSWVSKNQEVGEDKSLRLADLQPLLELPGVVFVDLQYGDTSAERAALLAATGIEVMRIPEIDNFNDIDGLAALMEACDVVVTVSNTTAHLAGALGRPLMVMLPEAFGLVWYWHAGRRDSPWYPGAKLFRQQTPGQWGSVIHEVSNQVLELNS